MVVCRAPHILVEALSPDFQGNKDLIRIVSQSGLDVFAHNIETTEACTPHVRDRRANYRQSLRVLEQAKADGVKVTKTSMMLGVGETRDQMMQALKGTSSAYLPSAPRLIPVTELREVDVDVVTFGQYMRPTKRHMKVDRYVDPAEFDEWRDIAMDMGFLYVASGPLVRSSYKVRSFPVLSLVCTETISAGGRVLHREYHQGSSFREASRAARLQGRPDGRHSNSDAIDLISCIFLLWTLFTSLVPVYLAFSH